MVKKKLLLTDEQWSLIEPLLPKQKASPKGTRKPVDNRQVPEGVLWILHSGRSFPPYIHRRSRVGVGFATGTHRRCGPISGGRCRPTSTRPAGSTGRRHFSMRASLRREKGALRQEDQTWQAHRVHGAGGRPMDFCEPPARFCLVRRNNAA
jgi:transposase